MNASDPAVHPETVLLWQVGALGDTLLAYPAMAALRAWAPSARISMVGRPSLLRWALRAGLIDAAVDPDGAIGASLAAGKGPGLHPVPDLAMIWSADGARIAAHLLRHGAGTVLHAPARPALPLHQARYLVGCLQPLGVPRTVRAVHMPAPEAARAETGAWLARDPALSLGAGDSPVAGAPLILLHPGSGSRWKRWPLDHFLRLSARLRGAGMTVQWSCGPADEELRGAILQADPEHAASLWPELDLEPFAARLARVSLLVSPDCGVAHLAALFGVPQLTLFGPTDARRWRPLNRKARILRAPVRCGGTWQLSGTPDARDLALRCCLPAAEQSCRCLAGISTDEVFAACMEMQVRR